MFALSIISMCTAYSDPPRIPSISPSMHVDGRIRVLRDKELRNDPKKLAVAIDELWKFVPDIIAGKNTEAWQQIQILAYFISIKAPVADARNRVGNYGSAKPIYAMLYTIGLPAVPHLLEQLRDTPDDTDDGRTHRVNIVNCLRQIYEQGGEGERMVVQRIKMYAEDYDAGMKKRILAGLDHLPNVKPPPK